MTTLDDINGVLDRWCQRVVEKIQTNLDSTGTTASGRSKQSLGWVVADGTLRIYARPFFSGVETGRTPGRIPYNFTDILFQWASDKGILTNFGNTESRQRSALYLVGQFIKNSGTKLYRNGGRTDIYTDVITQELEELERQVAVRVSQSVVKSL